MAMTDKILSQLIKFQIINREDEEIYRFGLEALFLKGFHYISYLLIAFLCSELPKFIIFFAAFFLIRKNAGGYHARTKAGCYAVSCLVVFSVIMFLKYMLLREILYKGMIILFVVANGVILWLAPIGNKNRELDNEEKRYFRKRSIVILGIENILVLFFCGIQKNTYAAPIMIALICSAFLLILTKTNKDIKV